MWQIYRRHILLNACNIYIIYSFLLYFYIVIYQEKKYFVNIHSHFFLYILLVLLYTVYHFSSHKQFRHITRKCIAYDHGIFPSRNWPSGTGTHKYKSNEDRADYALSNKNFISVFCLRKAYFILLFIFSLKITILISKGLKWPNRIENYARLVIFF